MKKFKKMLSFGDKKDKKKKGETSDEASADPSAEGDDSLGGEAGDTAEVGATAKDIATDGSASADAAPGADQGDKKSDAPAADAPAGGDPTVPTTEPSVAAADTSHIAEFSPAKTASTSTKEPVIEK